MTTITRRVTATVSDGTTRRVNVHGHASDYDRWGVSWGTSWGVAWFFERVASAFPNVTVRVAFHHELILEGDESGKLLLEGDQSGNLGLEGDMAAELYDLHVKRVTL